MGNSPNVVINCTGILKIKNSEDFLNAIKINSILPIKLSLLAKSYGFRLIHFSTDGVFDGSKGNYYEQDEINLLDSYGQTKYLGEVIENEAFTIRTSIIGHQYYTEEGLVNWFLNSKDSVNGYSNYIYSGLPAVEIARIIDEFILPNIDLNGLYHISSNPMSKFDILNLMASIYGKKIEIIPLPNPKIDRSLNDSKFRNDSGYKPKSWDNLIIEMKNDFQENLSKYFK